MKIDRARGALQLIRLLPFRLFSEYPYTDIAGTIRDLCLVGFKTRQKPHCVSIDELDSFQIENDGLVALFHETF
ncbi:MAG: hypothetical protein ACXW50_20590 [Candidatus Binatia bacterium]